MLDARRLQRALEFGHHLRTDASIGAAPQREHRTRHAVGQLGRRRQAAAVLADRPAVEADDARQAILGGRLHEADAAADAEAHGVRALGRAAVRRAQERGRGGDVGMDGVRAQLPDVLLVLESVQTASGAGGAAEVVDCHRVDTGLRKAQCQLLEEGMQPAHIRQHHDARSTGPFGPCHVGRHRRPIRRGQGDRARIAGGPADGWQRRSGVVVVAHPLSLAARCPSGTKMPGEARRLPRQMDHGGQLRTRRAASGSAVTNASPSSASPMIAADIVGCAMAASGIWAIASVATMTWTPASASGSSIAMAV